MSGSMSVGGLASGLDTETIIAKIMETARRPQNQMLTEKAEAQEQLTAWQLLNTNLLALKTCCDSLAVTGAFNTCSATSSDTDIVTVSASTSAIPGTHYLKITARAQTHQISSQAYSSMETDIGTGTLSISFSQDSSKDFDVTIDSTNNTLSGLRDAINRADGDVSASIINSGTEQSPEYRLLITSTDTGAATVFSVDTSGLSGGTTPSITQVVQEACDAQITFGEGAGAITVTKDSNTITDLIPGVTLNISTADPDEIVKIDITRDTDGIKTSIATLVSQYNDLMDAIDQALDYDVDTGSSGPLMGSWDLQSVQMNIISQVTNPVTGLGAQFSALSSMGITLTTAGHLVIDDSELASALNDNPEEVTKLFASSLESDSSYVSYVSSTADTDPSGTDGWDVSITQAATRAQVTAGVSLTGTLSNDETLTIYSTASNVVEIDLTAGMTLAEVVAEINLYASETGVTALATGADGTGTGDYLTLRTQRYGSAAELHAYSSLSNQGSSTTGVGNALITADEPAGESGTGVGQAGLDVEGTINGEACTGSGQILTASLDDEDSSITGLMLTVTAGSPMTTTVYFTKGVGARLRDLLVNMTSSTGVVTAAENSLGTEIEELDDTIADMETQLAAQEERLWTQFSAMETQLAQLQQQAQYLTAQFEAMANS